MEAAKLFRLQGKLEDALGREQDAIRWLKEPSVQAGEAQRAWAIDVSPDHQVGLSRLDEKESYAELELAATKFLINGNDGEAALAVRTAFGKSSSRQPELTAILNWELHRLGSERPELTERSDKFLARFLGSSGFGK